MNLDPKSEPGFRLPVDLVSSGDADLDAKNVKVVEGKWNALWPDTLIFLKEMKARNDFDTDFPLSSLRVKWMRADVDLSTDKEWEVSFTVAEDGFSEWGIAFNDFAIDPDGSQPYDGSDFLEISLLRLRYLCIHSKF